MTSKPGLFPSSGTRACPMGMSGAGELPARGPGGVRCKGGVSSSQALARNRRICRLDTFGSVLSAPRPSRGRSSVATATPGESTDARHRGGPARSSDEGPVMGPEPRGGAGQVTPSVNPAGDELMERPQLGKKSFEIQKRLVYEAWMKVQANKGAPGVDAVSIEGFAENERANLYMSRSATVRAASTRWGRTAWWPPPSCTGPPRAGDPQLHTHVLVAKRGPGRRRGVVRARRPPPLPPRPHGRVPLSGRPPSGAGRGPRGPLGPVHAGMAELEGVPKDLLRGFSTRRREIEHLLGATGATSARSAEVAALVTRRAKEPQTDDGEAAQSLRERWLE